ARSATGRPPRLPSRAVDTPPSEDAVGRTSAASRASLEPAGDELVSVDGTDGVDRARDRRAGASDQQSTGRGRRLGLRRCPGGFSLPDTVTDADAVSHA